MSLGLFYGSILTSGLRPAIHIDCAHRLTVQETVERL